MLKINVKQIDFAKPLNTSFIKNEKLLEHIAHYKAKKEFIRSYSSYNLLYKMVLKYFNLNLNECKFSIDENGKPTFKEFCYSISHSEEYIAVALSNKNVGIDVQVIKEIHFPKLFAEKILTDADLVGYHNAIDKNTFLNYKWSALEAKVKFIGTGLKTTFKLNTNEVYQQLIEGNVIVSLMVQDNFITTLKKKDTHWHL